MLNKINERHKKTGPMCPLICEAMKIEGTESNKGYQGRLVDPGKWGEKRW